MDFIEKLFKQHPFIYLYDLRVKRYSSKDTL